MKITLALAVSLTALTFAAAVARADDNVVTVYSADGLHDGTPSWYQTGPFFSAPAIRCQSRASRPSFACRPSGVS